ncbi:putative zinc metalloproteinase C607.06c isoform X2 [Ischnura elegans]|uniref:putative zinc metalloproteinase C607.06c isoform X2 n=1 Tax=Ischnura elegans TaxID=197161 RepID=UPI001ED87D38|nr:putative zinc metalloproteinase C607.06c isoform X2 [Ischnura elegans]
MTTNVGDNSNHHCIQLSNVNNGDRFMHPICLLKGQIIAADPRCTGGKILLHQTGDDCQESVVPSEWEVTEWGDFRSLFSLKRGPNQIKIFWKCATCHYDAQLAIQIYYEERNTSFKVLPVWITCQDSEEESEEKNLENLKRVQLMAHLAQCVTSECLQDKGFGRSSIFCLDPTVAVFKSQLTSSSALSMNHEALWQHLARELMSSNLASHQTKYLAFLSCTRYETPIDDAAGGKKRAGRIKGHIALGAGGLALLGTASIHTWPSTIAEVLPHFLDSTPVDTQKHFDDSCRRGTYGGCFATAVGSVCHELGHTFDLGHTQNGIMGRGFHHIQKIFILPNHNEIAPVNRNCSEKLILNNASMEIKKQNSSISSTAQLNTDINISWSQPRKEFSTSTVAKEKKVKGMQRGLPGSKKPSKTDEYPFWSNGCAAILAFHRWFNDFPFQANTSEMITYNKQMRCVSSTAGLRVVQIRNDADGGAVMSSWQFLGPQGRSQFLIPSAFSFPRQNPQTVLSVIAEDSLGNILKDKL